MQIRLGCRHCDNTYCLYDVICGNCGVIWCVFGCNGEEKIERKDAGVENAEISGENFQGISTVLRRFLENVDIYNENSQGLYR